MLSHENGKLYCVVYFRFDTTNYKLTFADQFLEITTVLHTNYIYGLGEHRDRFLHNVSEGFTVAMWARGVAPANCVKCNLYGQHPFFIGLDSKSGTAYGVLLLNSNAMGQCHRLSGILPTHR